MARSRTPMQFQLATIGSLLLLLPLIVVGSAGCGKGNKAQPAAPLPVAPPAPPPAPPAPITAPVGAGWGNDFQPGTAQETTTWANWDDITFVDLPMADTNDKFQKIATKVYLATLNLYPDHCQDSGGTKRPHKHYEKDYTGDELRQTKGNHYYDLLYDGAPPGTAGSFKTTRLGDASNKINCHVYALSTFIQKGTYAYWMDNQVIPVAVGGDGTPQANSAFNVETQAFPKGTVQLKDVLYYWGNVTLANGGQESFDHSTGVVTVVAWPAQPGSSQPQTLRWKAGFSGIYELKDGCTWDTPKSQIQGGLTQGQVITRYGPNKVLNWDSKGAGDSAVLYPAGKVRRKS